MKILLRTLALCVGLVGGTAFAADMPLKARPPVAPIFSWTGFYAGVQGGYGWGRSAETFSLLPNSPTFDGSQTYNTSGGVFGGVLGYNLQTGNIVYGLETDINWSGIKGTSGIVNIGPPNLLDTYDSKLGWYGTARGKIGLAQNRWLAYITGGLAYGEVKHDYNPGLNVPNCGTVGTVCSNDVTRAGWVLGGGLEYALTNGWSVKAEYNYINLGNSSVQYTATPLNRSTWHDTFSIAKAGFNYHFSGTP